MILRTAALCLLAVLPAQAQEDGFKPLFDGKSLDGWDGDPKLWRAEDGTITGETTAENPTKGNTFLIWRQGEIDDFELKAEFKILGGNSGIQVRSWEEKEKWVVGGYQADIDAGGGYTGILYGERYRGILAQRGQKTVIRDNHKPEAAGVIGDAKELGALVKKEDWNEYHVTAKGYTFVQRINGTVMSECVDEDAAQRRRSGILALQLHAGPPMKVQFRNLRLKRLKLDDRKKVVFVAGGPSHGYGDHEHFAGSTLLARALNENPSGVQGTVYKNGWPKDPTAFDNADAIVIYSDGGGGHPAVKRLDEIDALMKKGVGLGTIHYAVEVPKGKPGDAFLDWIGGYFEAGWSVNPHWKAKFEKFPEHPVARGVKPFETQDEWYYHMRFRKDMEGVTPILTAVPPDSTRKGKDGTHSGNPTVREQVGQAEHVLWVYQRPGNAGRGFGCTGGHSHWNWGNDEFRKTVLNAVAWVSGAEVPAEGIPSKPVSQEQLEQNQDDPKPEKKK